MTQLRAVLYWLTGVAAALQLIATAWLMHMTASIPGLPYATTQLFLDLLGLVSTLLVVAVLVLLTGLSHRSGGQPPNGSPPRPSSSGL